MNLDKLLACKKPPEGETLQLSHHDLVRFFWKYKDLQVECARNDAFMHSMHENLQVAYNKKDETTRAVAGIKNDDSVHQVKGETVSALLEIGPQVCLDFISETCELLSDFDSRLSELDTRREIDYLSGKMQSLKAMAAGFRFHYLADVSNNIIKMLQGSQTGGPVSRKLLGRIRAEYKILIAETRNIKEMNERLINFSRVPVKVRSRVQRTELKEFFRSLKDMVTGLSRRQGKVVRFGIRCCLDEVPYLKDLKNPLIRLVRNAVEHGIEDPYLRLFCNKPPQGSIALDIRQENGFLSVRLRDDGHGIDFREVGRRAAGMGLLEQGAEVSHARLLRILFSARSGIKKEYVRYSERRFGLDVVKDVVGELKGKINIKTEEGKGMLITLMIPLRGSSRDVRQVSISGGRRINSAVLQ